MKKIPVLVLTLLLCLALPAFAELCSKCKDHSYTKDIGECTACQGMTTSGEYKLCFQCSTKLGECAHCRTALPKAVAAKLAAVTAIDMERNGTYSADGWVYAIRITNEGSRSKGVVGELSYQGAAVAEPAEVNAYHATPWGKVYWVGNPFVAFGAHGWMPKPLVSAPVGAELPQPAAAPKQ